MNYISIYNAVFAWCRWGITVGLLLLLIAGCTKIVPPLSLKTPDNTPDSTRDVRKVLDSVPGFSLFARACKRASLSDLMDPAGFYTLFVPTDSAMTAAGLTADVINSISLDSLRNLLEYHITYGAVSDTTLINAIVSLQQNCLLETTVFSPQGTATQGYSTYRHSLFVKYYGGVLNINGWAVNAGELPVKAGNGYLYAMNQVLQPPVQRLSDIVFSRPELSYYAAAISIIDSLYRGLNWNGTDAAYEDSILFSQLRFESVVGNGGSGNSTVTPVHPTVFAPTNTAFINAGIVDIPALRSWILNGVRADTLYEDPNGYYWNDIVNIIPGNGYVMGSNGGWQGVFNYVPVDSMLKMHYLLNVNQSGNSIYNNASDLSFSNSLCYSDLTGSPSVNNGVLNISSLNGNTGGAVITPYTLRFYAGATGLLTIQWNAAGLNNAVIPKDKNQLERKRNFWTMNGVIYESDRLFYSK